MLFRLEDTESSQASSDSAVWSRREQPLFPYDITNEHSVSNHFRLDFSWYVGTCSQRGKLELFLIHRILLKKVLSST
jgi:hypothetical protein